MTYKLYFKTGQSYQFLFQVICICNRREFVKQSAYRILVEKSEGKRLLGRPTCRWEDNIKMDLNGVVWIGLIWLSG
jgi:hypothetical protein